jgi:carbamoyl-phosphate synthase large subunit
MVRVLVTSAGTIVAQGVMKSLRLANLSGQNAEAYTIVGADMSPQAVGLYRSDIGILVPGATSQDYIDAMITACRKEGVAAIFVGSDEELLPLSRASERIEAETGAVVISNPTSVIETCVDKWKTFQALKSRSLPCAESRLPQESEDFVAEFGLPVMVKPREGHGSLHAYLARDKPEVEAAIRAIEGAGWRPILQEYLSDAESEFTTGVIIDRAGKAVLSSISMRRKLKAGQTYRAVIDDFPEVREAAETVARELGCRGPVNVQCREAGGVPKTFEVNPRISASTPMRAVAGVNEPDILFRNWVRQDEAKVSEYARIVCLRYWNEVYVPTSEYEEMARAGRREGTDSFIPEYF